MDETERAKLWLGHNELFGSYREGVSLGLVKPLSAPATLDEVLAELRRLNDGLEYDRAIARWKRGEGKHPGD